MLSPSLQPPPSPTQRASTAALRALIRSKRFLPALEALHKEMGPIFRLSMLGFQPVVLSGPSANRFVLVEARSGLRWRSEHDPVTNLLRRGVLVQDGDAHDCLRNMMNPAFQRGMLDRYASIMWECTSQVCATWDPSSPLDMLIEMRRITLLILMRCLFAVDFSRKIEKLWRPVMSTLDYISPGPWLVWPSIPRPGYRKALHRLDLYLYRIIAQRRAYRSSRARAGGDDLLSIMVSDPAMDDELIKDQLLTMLIAGHDTSTALLSWALYLLGRHPETLRRAQEEVDRQLGSRAQAPSREQLAGLSYMGQVINETLRLYPPIHMGNRRAATDLEFNGYLIPAGTRVTFSIYLTHRDPQHWPHPGRFDPSRFAPEAREQIAPYAFIPFGAGPRNCIGSGFAMLEARAVLACILSHFNLRLLEHPGRPVQPHMGATLAPRPGVPMWAQARQ